MVEVELEGVFIEAEGSVSEIDRARGGLGAFEDGLDAQDEFLRAEGFGEIIVGSGFEPLDAILGLGTGGEHDDGDFGGARVATQFTKHRITVTPGQHQVQNDEGGALSQGDFGARNPIVGFEHLVSCPLEVEADELGDVRFVLNYQNTGHGTRRIRTA